MRDREIDARFGDTLGLKGKTAVITGGAGNIGRAISLRLSSMGVKTVVVYNASSKAAFELVGDIDSGGARAAAYQADVAQERGVEELFRSIEEDDRFGRVDIMINNSALFSVSEQTELPGSEWQRLFGVNALGTFLCSREAAKMMKRQKPLNDSPCRGAIINIGSINALHPGFGGTAHYDSTKGAVSSFTRSLAAELGPSAIRVNAVAPGLVDSAGLRSDAAPLAEMVEGRSPLADTDGVKRLVAASDVANTVVYLASNLASAVTGEIVIVDRGYLLT